MKNIGKKAVALTLSVSMLSAMCMTANAANNSVSVTLDGKKIETAAYVDSSNRTQVPVEMAVQIGLSYSRDGDQATFVKGAEELTLQNSSAGYVTLRSLAEYFGYQLTWDGDTRTAVLVSPDTEAVDFDSIEKLEKDFSQAAQLPLTGYYSKSFEDGRSVKAYIAGEASIRSYFTVVAVPDGVNTKQFLEDEGWIALADQKGEGLFVLEPGTDGWGSPQEESAYLEEAINFLKGGNNVHGQNVFSTFGEFYLAGYGKGAAALELWAAANPIFVISQVYVDGQSSGTAELTKVASTLYDGKSANGDITDVLADTLKQVGIGGEIAPKDVPVPTWLIGYTGSEDYWKNANDCVSEAVSGVYYQSINSNAYQTHYSNQQLKEQGAKYGISQVKISDGDPTAAQLYSFMSVYTRYDTTFAYSNAIAYRLDYTSARVAAQQAAKDGKVDFLLSDGTQVLAQKDVKIAGHGTVQVGVIAFSDNNGDGKWDPREYMLYIPEGYQGEELPVMYVYPGNTQTDSIFMDSTLWWQVAEQEGFVVAIICETYNASPSSVSHADSDKFYASLMTILTEQVDGKYADLDFSRVYCTGQSAGSIATQGFAMTNPEFFAAVGSTSAIPVPRSAPNYDSYDTNMKLSKVESNEPIPTMFISAQMDVSDLALGFDSQNIQDWGNYMLKANGIDKVMAADTASRVASLDSRHNQLYIWSRDMDGTEVPLVEWVQCILRPHNCYPSEMPMIWDFVKHFSFEKAADGTVTRYYSASAFAQDDAVVIQ